MKKEKEAKMDSVHYEVMENLLKIQIGEILKKKPFHFAHVEQIYARVRLIEQFMKLRTENGGSIF